MITALCCIIVMANTLNLLSQDFTRVVKLTTPIMHGKDIEEIQTKLLSLGFSQIGSTNGWYGHKTQDAVREYQDCLGLSRNGIIDKTVWESLFSEDKITEQVNPTLKLINAMQVNIKNEYDHKRSPIVYHYISGEHYSKSEYSTVKSGSDSVFLGELIVAVKRDKGILIHSEINTPSGDWFIVQDNYYDKDGKIAYVYWNMNTFQASLGEESVPASISKRIYFDKAGDRILQRVKAYRMNTDTEMSSQSFGFMDREVEVHNEIEKLEYYHLLKW